MEFFNSHSHSTHDWRTAGRIACVCLRVRADDGRAYRVGAARGTRCARRCYARVALRVTVGRVSGLPATPNVRWISEQKVLMGRCGLRVRRRSRGGRARLALGSS